MTSSSQNTPAQVQSGGVKIKNLTKVYTNAKLESVEAVKNLSVTFPVDQVTTIVGHNGAGKSTTMFVNTYLCLLF